MYILKVDMALAVGLHSVTWSSLNIQAFFQKVSVALQEFQIFNKQVYNVVDTHTRTFDT